MTSFNAASILMPLDDYYEHCVLPKPNIPMPYPGICNNKKRLAGNLKSYKDNVGDNEDDGEDEEMYNYSIQHSKINQLECKPNELQKLFVEFEDPTEIPVTNIIAESAQWRLQVNNVNRPQGAAPLVPCNAISGPQPSSIYDGCEKRRRYNRNRGNNNNYPHNSVHKRLGYNPQQRGAQRPMEQRISNAYNAFNNQQAEPNNRQRHHQFLMNNNVHNGHPKMNQNKQYSADVSLICKNPSNHQFHYGNQNNSHIQNFEVTNSLSSLISAANKIPNMQTPVAVPHRFGAPMQNHQNENGETCYFGENSNQNNNLQRNKMGGTDSLRLADLMNMDENSCKNLNVSEVAKNAMLLLNSVFHKPILNEDIQHELSELQKKNENMKVETGINMDLKPEVTDVQMYHRFK